MIPIQGPRYCRIRLRGIDGAVRVGDLVLKRPSTRGNKNLLAGARQRPCLHGVPQNEATKTSWHRRPSTRGNKNLLVGARQRPCLYGVPQKEATKTSWYGRKDPAHWQAAALSLRLTVGILKAQHLAIKHLLHSDACTGLS